MGQQEVYDFLKSRKGKWFTTKEMGDILYPGRKKLVSSLTLNKLERGGCVRGRERESSGIQEWSYRAEDESPMERPRETDT